MPEAPSTERQSTAADRLSLRRALSNATPELQQLAGYEPLTLWEHDTAALPETLRMLRQHTRHFAQQQIAPRALAADLFPHDRDVENEVLAAAFAAGLFGNQVPVAADGAATCGKESLSLDDFPLAWSASIRSEELAAACGGWALLLAAHALGATPLVLSGDRAAMKRVFEKAKAKGASGQPYLFAYAITEPAAGSDVEDSAGASDARPTTVARRTEGGWLLNGRKVFTSGGDIADAVMVFAALEEDGAPASFNTWTCFMVERDSSGFARIRNEEKMGQRASAATELELSDAFVPDENVIGGLRQGWALNLATLNVSRIPVAAIALGIARGAMEAAIEFACRHRIAGDPLIERQEIQLQIAGMIAQTGSMRATIWEHARRPVPTQTAASLTKVSCSDAALRICESAMLLLSNHGVLHQYGVEKALRDVRLTQIYEGTNEINRLAIIEDLRSTFTNSSEGEVAEALSR